MRDLINQFLIHRVIPRAGHRKTVLTDEQVREIRSGKHTLKEMADKYGISISAVSRVKSRKTFKHVRDESN